MTRAVDLSVVIVNWHSREHLRRCLRALESAILTVVLEVVVIDSGSFDGSEELVRREFPFVRFIQSAENVGFAKANNIAYMETSGHVVLFLNPDTEVADDAIQRLYDAILACPAAGSVGGTLLNSDGSVQWTCVRATPTIVNRLLDSNLLRRWSPSSKLWGMSALYAGRGEYEEVDGISGACVMVRRDVFDRVGKFSEDYFMYAEDVDLSYKIRLAGFRNYYVPQATIVHHGGSSSDVAGGVFSTVMMREATWRFFRKTRGAAYSTGYRLSMCLGSVCRLALLLFGAPAWLITGRARKWRGAMRRNRAIFGWSVHMHRSVVRQYYSPR